MKTVYDFKVKTTDDSDKSLTDYKGNVLLIVNTASKCGLAPQFEELEVLYGEHQEEGLEILGFPCGQFKDQEYDDIDETLTFCQKNYGVTFPMFAKIDVNGETEHPLYTFLKSEKSGMLSDDIKWNFTKFLIDRNGQVVKRYAPTTKPSKIKKDIVKELQK